MRKALVLLLLLALSVGILLAKDFWKEKPYTEWTLEETQKMLSDSPWGHRVQIGAMTNEDVAGFSGRGTPETGGMPSGGMSTGGGYPSATPGSQTSSGAPSGTAYPAQGAAAVYSVWWTSARTFRQGFARHQQLRGTMTAEQAKTFAETRPTDFMIAITGPNMSAFQSANEDSLQSITYLRPKRLKRKISPTHVEIQRSADGQRIGAILFSFPRTVDGQPTIAPDEKSVEFGCDLQEHRITTSFDVRDMKTGTEQDL